jgi:antitoxin (DNA-binding transcriptional repressor) of toxin-antitoxin stability system
MSTATLQQLGLDLPSWMARVRHGEIINIMDEGQIVAKLSPVSESSVETFVTHGEWPDFAARRRAIFRDKVLPAGTAQELIDEDRGE